MNYVIFDLEATCTENRDIRQEIIEIGAVKINNGEIAGIYNSFVRPVINPLLSDFCKNLTNITQVDVSFACTFPIVIEEFKEWINLDNEYTLCSWGNYDIKQLKLDCEYYQIKDDWIRETLNLKEIYPQMRGKGKELGLQKALRIENINFEGIPHRAISDAINTTQLFLRYLNKWDIKK